MLFRISEQKLDLKTSFIISVYQIAVNFRISRKQNGISIGFFVSDIRYPDIPFQSFAVNDSRIYLYIVILITELKT